ncbi:sensor histidine kinase, partial [Staphylococcus hyicus]
MNQYVRSIGSMLILVYSLFTAFFFIDNVFTNIIFFQGSFYTQIFWITLFLFLNRITIFFCIVVGMVLSYKNNQKSNWLKAQIERHIEGGTVGAKEEKSEKYIETVEV